MRLSLKILIWSWIVLFLVLGGLIFGAYSKLKPESLVNLLNTQVQKSYPGSHLTIGEIDYGVALDFKLSLRSLTLTQKEKTLASASDVQVKIPWWLVLFNRGNAQLNISNLIVFVSSVSPDISSVTSGKNEGEKENINLTIPQYLMDAQYTVRAKNISIKELDGDRRYFTLSKLLVREFQYGKNSAFELNIPISITHKNKRYTSDLWLFGDMTPSLTNWIVNYRGEFKTKESADGLRFDELVIDGKSTFDPRVLDLTSQIELSIDRRRVGSGEIFAKNNQFQFQVQLTELPLDFLNLFGDEIKNPFWSSIEGNAQGEVKFSKDYSKEQITTLSAKLYFPGEFTVTKDYKIHGQWHLNFENEKWKTSFSGNKGEVEFSRRAILNFEKSEVSQYSQEIGLSNCDYAKALSVIQPLALLLEKIPQPYHSTVVLLKKCIEGEEIFDGTFRYGNLPDQKYFQGEISGNNSKFSLNYSEKADLNQFELNFTNFFMRSSFQMLAPYFSSETGLFDGKIQGKWKGVWEQGTWLVNLKADQLKNSKGDFEDLNHNFWEIFNIDDTSIVKKSWNATVNKKVIKISEFILDSVDPASLSGSVSAGANLKSYLTLNYPKNKNWKPVKKEVSQDFWKKEEL